jgi:hypothetical protein
MRAPAVLLVACGLLAAGCGDSEEPAASTPTPTSTPTASPTAFAPSAPEPPAENPEAQPGGAGDEQPARYRTRLTIGRSGISPARVAVRGFFALEFVIRNDTRSRRRVNFEGETVSVPGMAAATLRHGGVRPGRHTLRAGSAGRVEVLAAPPGEP